MWDVGFYFRVFYHPVHKCGELIILIKRVVVESEGESHAETCGHCYATAHVTHAFDNPNHIHQA